VDAGNGSSDAGLADGGSAGGLIFESNWDTAAGTSKNAVTDGARWTNYWEFDNGSGVQLLSVVAGGPKGHNALRVQQRGTYFSVAAAVQVDNLMPASRDYYVRYYMKNDDTSPSGDHIVTVDIYQYPNLTYMRKYSSASGWRFVISMYGCVFTYPIGHVGPALTLAHGAWYRFEYFVHFVDATHIQTHPRVYDSNGTLIAADADFLQEDYKAGGVWNGRDDWTLQSIYASGHAYCVVPAPMTSFAMGNNGQAGAVDTGLYWYYAALQIRSDTWPGP
jgi:hypothetical protein